MEAEGRDWLVSVNLQQDDQSPTVLHAPRDFGGYMALSHEGHTWPG